MISSVRNTERRALVSVYCAFIVGMSVENLVVLFVTVHLLSSPVSTAYRQQEMQMILCCGLVAKSWCGGACISVVGRGTMLQTDLFLIT
jgi:hypothetical protein